MLKLKSINEYPTNPGIYKFTNKTNRKVYIGETNNFKVRMQKYKCSHNKGKIIHLITRAMLKYGVDGFDYEIIEIFPEGVSKAILLDREEFWIKIYDSTNKKIGYNISKRGRSMVGFKMPREAVERTRLKNIGRKHRPESCRKMSISRSGDNHWTKKLGDKPNPMTGRKFSEERRRAMSIYLKKVDKKNLMKAVNQIDPKTGEIINTFDSVGYAAEILNGDKKKYHGISHVLNGDKETAYGFKWEYAEPSKRKPKSNCQL